MPPTIPINLESRVAVALTDSKSELWFSHLTQELVQTKWGKLKEVSKINESNYGTARVILNDAKAPRNIVHSLSIKNLYGEVKEVILVELLPNSIKSYYQKSKVDFYSEENFSVKGRIHNEILDCLGEAFNIIKQVPNLFETVVCLVRCIHLIKSKSDEYDVSFSEPHIPFSIFVSVPQKNNPINVLRVAEAIVHEAMHLQLTLIENVIPLITNSDLEFYSPWKLEYRTVGGVLHALYVFRVLYSFWEEIIKQNCLLFAQNDHLDNRRNLIVDQICDIESFSDCKVITPLGREFVAKLLF